MTEFNDANDFEKALFRNYNLGTCNGFSWSYAKNNDNVVVKVGEMSQGSVHCWVYDANLNLTIDPTLGQFDGLTDGYWEGEEHPHCYQEWSEWESHENFVDHFDASGSPFIVN